jgi:hypothetical protein
MDEEVFCICFRWMREAVAGRRTGREETSYFPGTVINEAVETAGKRCLGGVMRCTIGKQRRGYRVDGGVPRSTSCFVASGSDEDALLKGSIR